MIDQRSFAPRLSTDSLLLLLRICIGVVFVIGGVKLAFPADPEALAASYVDQSSGWISSFFADRISGGLGIDISTFLRTQGFVEILLGLALMLGLFTTPVAVVMGLMYWSFTVANPVVGQIRLSRDLALMGVCFALALSGAGARSLDFRFLKSASRIETHKDIFLIAIRLSLGFTLVTSALFAGGVFNNHLNTTLPRIVVLIVGFLLALGVYPRWLGGALALWMLYLLGANLVTKGLFLGLDSVKRELGFFGSSIVLFVMGADRWAVLGDARASPAPAEPPQM